jgi:hypothetical protein
MRTHSLVSAAALSLGLAFTAPALLAQDTPDRGSARRWPAPSDGGAGAAAGKTAVARSAMPSADPSRPAQPVSGIEAGRVPGTGRIAVDQGQLEQRRSPGGGRRDGGTVRGGGGGGGGRVAVPRGSTGGVRPGGGRPVIVQPRGFYGGVYPRFYYPYSSFYWGPGYFDSWGYWGNGFGPGWGYAGYPYGFGGYPGSGYAYDTGRLRLEVRPRDAEVFIDGYYAGQVDDFDGRLQGLTLETGGYSVEVRKAGWETLTFDVRVTPGRTTHYKGELIPRKE